MSNETEISRLNGNYYGTIYVRQTENGYEACVENWDGFDWQKIPEYLYEALKQFQLEEDVKLEEARLAHRKKALEDSQKALGALKND